MDLKVLVDEAAEAESEPLPPEGGIPKQRLPGFIRWPIRTLFLPFVWMDRAAQKIARMIIRPPFKRAGSCNKRGNCCYYILFKKHRRFLNAIFMFWSREINGFYQRDPEPQIFDGKPWYVMGCRYLKKNGSCGHYHYRPSICRSWPIIDHFGYPKILKGCGFKVVSRNEKTSPLNILK